MTQKHRSFPSNADVQTVTVYDILPSNCLRKAFYSHKFPDLLVENTESVFYHTRGKAAEYAITKLANIGVSQKWVERGGITASLDIDGSDILVEIKDTTNGKRLTLADDQFRGYLIQALYYLALSEKEKAVIAINYNVKELMWDHKDDQGRSWFYRPVNAKGVGIESWDILMPKQDYTREKIWEQMLNRKNILLKARKTDNVAILPRVKGKDRNFKCSNCPFYNKCYNEDGETEEARSMINELEMLDIPGFVKVELGAADSIAE